MHSDSHVSQSDSLAVSSAGRFKPAPLTVQVAVYLLNSACRFTVPFMTLYHRSVQYIFFRAVFYARADGSSLNGSAVIFRNNQLGRYHIVGQRVVHIPTAEYEKHTGQEFHGVYRQPGTVLGIFQGQRTVGGANIGSRYGKQGIKHSRTIDSTTRIERVGFKYVLKGIIIFAVQTFKFKIKIVLVTDGVVFIRISERQFSICNRRISITVKSSQDNSRSGNGIQCSFVILYSRANTLSAQNSCGTISSKNGGERIWQLN